MGNCLDSSARVGNRESTFGGSSRISSKPNQSSRLSSLTIPFYSNNSFTTSSWSNLTPRNKSKVGVERNLVDWAIPYLVDRRKVFRIMDTKLGGQYPHKGACAAANIALRCLNTEPKLRPDMADVLSTLQQLETSSKKMGSTQNIVMSPSSHMS
ncbi:unnamed protein product [Arabidopsis thaliana]|uniref:(thale cress) hypothetical protein n=1 Tax=Arabidopsis thaliana TaxID=3702 RepID=A0A7G2E5B3_ARATH|nr:unnamed protein product [Arabidopsis thaliana]